MQQQGQHQQRNRLPALAFKNPGDGDQNERGGQIARMQVLVGDVQRRARHRQGKHGSHHGHSGPLRSRFGKNKRSDAPAGPQNQKKR